MVDVDVGRRHQRWSCYGKTDAKGDRVVEGEVGAGQVFATIYTALGINPNKDYHLVPVRSHW